MINRMMRAALLDVATFEEVEADTRATGQAILVVAVVALATGIGTFQAGGIGGLLAGVVIGLVGWVGWAYITFFLGTTLFKTPQTSANWGQMARVLGFAQTPGLLKALGIIPGIQGVVFLLASLWQFVAMVIAVRQGLDYSSTWRAVGVVVLGFIPYAVFILLLTVVLYGVPAA